MKNEIPTTESEMRNKKVSTPQSITELADYVNGLVEREHDYGTCVYAMSMAATAAFNFVASKLGVTGFQASCADLDILRRTRNMQCPFLLLKADDMLYPQYDLHQKLQEAMTKWKPWAANQARRLLAESTSAHPEVIQRWRELAAHHPPTEATVPTAENQPDE